jgi:hypothetical protein
VRETVPLGIATLRLAAGAAITATVWCGLLPKLLDVTPIQEHIALMEARGVDPSAMYYTELERLPLRPAWIDGMIILWP